jgi:hypothetical protein
VPLTPTPTWAHVKGIGHGKLKNHPDDEAGASPVQQQSGSLTTQSSSTVTVVVLAPAPAAPSNDNGNGGGHAYGRLKQGYNDHD